MTLNFTCFALIKISHPEPTIHLLSNTKPLFTKKTVFKLDNCRPPFASVKQDVFPLVVFVLVVLRHITPLQAGEAGTSEDKDMDTA